MKKAFTNTPAKTQNRELKTITLVTTNEEKVREIKNVLRPLGIRVKHASLELHETGTDQEKIAVQKAKQAFKILRVPVIVEDTGVYFEAYKNFPGVRAKREFLRLGFMGLLRKIGQAKDKRAHFLTIIAYSGGGRVKTFSGVLRGQLVEDVDYAGFEKRRKLPYESIFIPEGEKRQLSKISRKRKAEYSHRAKAARKFAKWLKSEEKV